MTNQQLLSFIQDVAQIAKYKLWDSDVGDHLAQALINEIHAGKYGRDEGVWPQFDATIGELGHKLHRLDGLDK